jgi:hypothetical protein
MPSDIVIGRVWIFTWKPQLCKLGGYKQANLEVQLKAMMERVRRYAFGGGN